MKVHARCPDCGGVAASDGTSAFIVHRPGCRLCACGCGTPLGGHRSDAKWASDSCSARWLRANPGRSKRDAAAIVVGRSKPVRNRPSGVSIRVGARKARDLFADELRARGDDPDLARARATDLIRPLVAPRHRSLIDA